MVNNIFEWQKNDVATRPNLSNFQNLSTLKALAREYLNHLFIYFLLSFPNWSSTYHH